MGEAASGRENGEKCTDSREKPQVKIMRTCLLIQLGNEVEGRIKDASQISSLRDWELAEHPCRLMKEPAWEGGWWCFECLSREKPSHVWKQKKQLRSFTLHWVSHQMVMTLTGFTDKLCHSASDRWRSKASSVFSEISSSTV